MEDGGNDSLFENTRRVYLIASICESELLKFGYYVKIDCMFSIILLYYKHIVNRTHILVEGFWNIRV